MTYFFTTIGLVLVLVVGLFALLGLVAEFVEQMRR